MNEAKKFAEMAERRIAFLMASEKLSRKEAIAIVAGEIEDEINGDIELKSVALHGKIEENYTMDDLKKAIIECVKQDDSVREFGSDEATIAFFLNRYNKDFKNH